MNHHSNDPVDCYKCEEIFGIYPGFHAGLKAWFQKVHSKFPDAHISCAGRGRIEQEAAYARGASQAHWGKSAHNYNMAIDLFRLDETVEGHYSLSRKWFEEVFAAFPLGDEFYWLGTEGSKFPEIPHVQVMGWADKVMADPDEFPLVEP